MNRKDSAYLKRKQEQTLDLSFSWIEKTDAGWFALWLMCWECNYLEEELTCLIHFLLQLSADRRGTEQTDRLQKQQQGFSLLHCLNYWGSESSAANSDIKLNFNQNHWHFRNLKTNKIFFKFMINISLMFPTYLNCGISASCINVQEQTVCNLLYFYTPCSVFFYILSQVYFKFSFLSSVFCICELEQLFVLLEFVLRIFPLCHVIQQRAK